MTSPTLTFGWRPTLQSSSRVQCSRWTAAWWSERNQKGSEMKYLALSLALLSAQPGPGGYEMTTYYVAFLYRGPAWTPASTPETEKIQNDHLANIQRLAAAGKLVLAGPFTDD